MAGLGQTLSSQGWPRFSQAPAQLSFPLSYPPPPPRFPSVLPRSKPSQQCWLLCSLEGRQNPHPPAAGLCDPSQLAPAPGPFGL